LLVSVLENARFGMSGSLDTLPRHPTSNDPKQRVFSLIYNPLVAKGMVTKALQGRVACFVFFNILPVDVIVEKWLFSDLY